MDDSLGQTILKAVVEKAGGKTLLCGIGGNTLFFNLLRLLGRERFEELQRDTVALEMTQEALTPE